jgi:hypothetical protein
MFTLNKAWIYFYPIVLNSVEGTEQKKTACYDIEVEVDDTLKIQMNNFLLSTSSQQEIQVSFNLCHYFMIYNSYHILENMVSFVRNNFYIS